MSGDFDWFDDSDPRIVLGYQPPTSVYASEGSIRIRQKADETEEYDPELFLTPLGALAVAWRLIAVAKEAGLPAPPSLQDVTHWPPPIPGPDSGVSEAEAA